MHRRVRQALCGAFSSMLVNLDTHPGAKSRCRSGLLRIQATFAGPCIFPKDDRQCKLDGKLGPRSQRAAAFDEQPACTDAAG